MAVEFLIARQLPASPIAGESLAQSLFEDTMLRVPGPWPAIWQPKTTPKLRFALT